MAATTPASSRWNFNDDVLLKDSVEAGASLESLARGAVQFSQEYTLEELQARWVSLLYDPVVSLGFLTWAAIERRSSTGPNGARANRKRRPEQSIRKTYYDERRKARCNNVNAPPIDSNLGGSGSSSDLLNRLDSAANAVDTSGDVNPMSIGSQNHGCNIGCNAPRYLPTTDADAARGDDYTAAFAEQLLDMRDLEGLTLETDAMDPLSPTYLETFSTVIDEDPPTAPEKEAGVASQRTYPGGPAPALGARPRWGPGSVVLALTCQQQAPKPRAKPRRPSSSAPNYRAPEYEHARSVSAMNAAALSSIDGRESSLAMEQQRESVSQRRSLGSRNDKDEEERRSEGDFGMPSFEDVEAMILDMDLAPEKYDLLANPEVQRLKQGATKRTVIRLEQTAQACLQRALASRGAYAVLFGDCSYHFINKPEVLIGRAAEEVEVDIDLGQLEASNKISRRQAVIKLNAQGKFRLKNVGKKCVSVNGVEVPPGQWHNLTNDCLIEMRGLDFIFKVNTKLVLEHANSLRSK